MLAKRMAHDSTEQCDVAVVGAGPAGLAAAAKLKHLGVARVLMIDRENDPGGIPRHCGHYPFGLREFGRLLRGPDYAARLADQAAKAGVTFLSRSTVTALKPGPTLEVSTPDGMLTVQAKRVLLATGTREKSRAQRFIGGTKPGGVLSTGALQGLVYLDKLVPFRRPVVVGTELVAFSALLTCRHAGIRPVAMIEPQDRITAYRGSELLPKLFGVPLYLRTTLRRILGGSRVEAAEIEDRQGNLTLIETDGVIVTGQFLSEAPLVRDSHLQLNRYSGGPDIDQFMRLSDPSYFAAGNILRPVETAGWCWSEGRKAAHAICASLSGELLDRGKGHNEALYLDVIDAPLKFAIPQRIVACGSRAGLNAVQLRVTRPVRGQLTVRVGDQIVLRKPVSTLPERRLVIPLSSLRPGSCGRATLSIAE